VIGFNFRFAARKCKSKAIMHSTNRCLTPFQTTKTFLTRGTCSRTLMTVLNNAYGHPLPVEEAASDPLAGGIIQYGYQCGMVWGSALAAGAQAYRLYGDTPLAELKAVLASRCIVRSFQAQNQHINCLEITDIDRTSTTLQMVTYFLLKGGTIGCFRMAARYAPLAHREIENAFAASTSDAPEFPVSCAGHLARKSGASGQHAVMAAGFAGGIGLSGEACGALGAAVWISGMNIFRKTGKLAYKDAQITATIHKFLQATDHEFECAKITGRNFDNPVDHSAYVRAGGCARLLEVLA
jgi:hypothetical protein